MQSPLHSLARGGWRLFLLAWALALVYVLGAIALALLEHTPLSWTTKPLREAWLAPRLTLHWADTGRETIILLGGAAVVFLLIACRGWIALRSVNGARPTLGVLFVLFASVTFCFWTSRVPSSAADGCCGGPSLVSQVQTIRSQLELYQIQHNGDYPTLAQLQNNWGVLVNNTTIDGTLRADGEFGPYLSQPPTNPYTKRSDVSEGSTAAWNYDEKAGEIYAVVPPEIIVNTGMTATDAKPMDMTPGLPGVVALQAIRAKVARERFLAECLDAFNLGLPAILLAIVLVRWLRMAGWVGLTPPTQKQLSGLLMLLRIACVHLLTQAWVWKWDGLALVAFASVILVTETYSLMLKRGWDRIDTWHDRSICRRCLYDLRGTLAASRIACPECGEPVTTLYSTN